MKASRLLQILAFHRINSFVKIVSALLLLTSVQACQNSEMSDLKGFVSSAYKDRKPEIEPLPEIQPYKGFEYAGAEDQDPFNYSNIVTNRSDGVVAVGDTRDANRRREALEGYPLDALKMVGTMTQQDVPWVIVQTSEGTAHRATVGNYMGQNEGKIKTILTDEQKIVLSELVLDPAGRWVTREVELIIDE